MTLSSRFYYNMRISATLFSGSVAILLLYLFQDEQCQAWTPVVGRNNNIRATLSTLRSPTSTRRIWLHVLQESLEESSLSSSEETSEADLRLATNNGKIDDQSTEQTTTNYTGTQPSLQPRVDILLNQNAKDVDEAVLDTVRATVQAMMEGAEIANQPRVHVHVTATLEQARQVVQVMVEDPPTLLIPLGGDGTLTTLLQLLWDAGMDTNMAARDGASNSTAASTRRSFPPIGYIAQGTGNALGSVVGCRPPRKEGRLMRWKRALVRRPSWLGGTSRKLTQLSTTLEQLLQAATELSSSSSSIPSNVDIVELPLLQVSTSISKNDKNAEDATSQLCFFSGVGFDSLMLQDYKDLQDYSKQRPYLKTLCSGVLGYCVALVTRTLPQCIQDQKHLMQVQVSTLDPDETLWIDHRRGDVVRRISQEEGVNPKKKKTLLYQGEAGIVAVGSAPFYGGGLRLFPFSRMTRDGMQLRIGRIHPLTGTWNIPQIFQGSYRDFRDDTFGCLDFMGKDFRVDILSPSQGYPVQHSGDFVGTSKQINFQMMGDKLEPVRFVTLLPPRMVVEESSASQS